MSKTGPKPRKWEEILDIIQERSHWEGECFIWEGSTAGEGYGTICFNGKTHYIHRLVYKYLVCDTPTEVVRHSCDNPRCWNPAHLTGGLHADNVRDKVSRDRHCYGTKHYKATLTEDQVLEIRYSNLPNETLALKYGVTRGCIHGIRSGRTWKHVVITGD